MCNVDRSDMQRHFRIFALLTLFQAPSAAVVLATDELQTMQQQLVEKTTEYRDELVKLLAIRENSLKSLEQDLGKRRRLFADGLISRQELEQSDSRLNEADGEIRELRKQVTQAEELAAEVRLALETPRADEPDAPVIRFAGNGDWSLNQVPALLSFFSRRFGEKLPVSAVGQTALHSRFGLLHTTAIDVALHPDSEEGQGLIEYLRQSGTPFIAFRAAVPGSATGAHIHIGPPSMRIHTAL